MRKCVVYIDENLPNQLAAGLNNLQYPLNKKDELEIEVRSIKEDFGTGMADEEWIPRIGEVNGVVITQDFRIQTQRHQKELYIENGVGILFLNPPSKSGFRYWDIVKLLVSKWEEIRQIIKRDQPPFAYRCSSRSNFEKFD